ncbi:MAG: hypothetical protein KME03_01435 [Aphanocapsa lilacina HA4352-LM1]|jgi:hypothetical protein|uniref:Gsr0733 protein n=2 Tax=Gloeobacter TaxID=33071 RepID=Q7NMN2_GLOVI|nr:MULTISPECIES: hypothetical protein [Gloeobacter]MBW4696562.1 hypothetical protein [Aphanocapsa lilacina HA4352-LM1]UFP96782.1 hypothetical protein ISF26_11475 [Gloeobacter morelensis MG652769]BAC88674.1 gsr0733 [Gloeobacter violaceus PCC 7421]
MTLEELIQQQTTVEELVQQLRATLLRLADAGMDVTMHFRSDGFVAEVDYNGLFPPFDN